MMFNVSDPLLGFLDVKLTYMIRINSMVAATRGNTPALRRIMEATMIPVLGLCS